MKKKKESLYAVFFYLMFISSYHSYAQTNINNLSKLSDEDWLGMTTEQRLDALNTSNNRAQNQTFVGNFNAYQDMYSKWGYNYYEMSDRYESYAFRGFENYNIIEDRRLRWYYNDFGDRLAKMTKNASIWNETYYDDGRSSITGPGGFINSQLTTSARGTNPDIDGIWVARESTDDWAVSAIGAGSLRAKMTPLTVSIPNMNGMTIDFQSQNYKARYINSVRVNDSWGGTLAGNMLMMRGGQIKRSLGVLTIGATYANMYAIQNTREGGNNLRGHVSDYAPTPLIYAIRVVDDSPQDGDGPTVQNVCININGKPRPDIMPTVLLDDLSRELITAIDSKAEYEYLEPKITGQIGVPFDKVSVEERIPKYLDYIYFSEYLRGSNTKHISETIDIEQMKSFYTQVSPNDKIQVNGSQYVVYMFDIMSITERVRRVEVELTVSNDYRVQTSQIYTKKKSGGHDTRGDNFNHYSAEYWQTRAQADGNIKDGSNLRRISIDFGYEVANIIWGFDAQMNYRGLKINAEYVTNTHYWMFADGVPGTGLPSTKPTDITRRAAHRTSQSDNSYYMTIQKDWERFGFACEIFKMNKFYRPHMQYWMSSEIQGGNTPYNSRNDIIMTSMNEDNDDNDAYPDLPYESRIMAISMMSLVDPDGTFPGNDLDHDGLPDNDKNYNNHPDYNEPFLMFDVDPDAFVFGDDFNNNNIPDFREDDLKFDTPYDLDRQGHHFYLRYTPQQNINFFIGSMKTGGVGLDTKNDIDYFKLNVKYDVFMIGNIFTEYRYERIKDNIQDKFVVVPTELIPSDLIGSRSSGYHPELYFDEVEFRNSKVNKLFVDSQIRPIPSITVENHLKYIHNNQIEGIMYDNTFQPADVLSTLAMVNKIAYTRQMGNWTFSPGIKLRLYKKGRSQSINPLDHYLMSIPLVYLKYRLSPNTGFTFGMQGMKDLELTYKDYIQSRNDYKQINYILQIENKSNYMGFEVWGGFGFKFEQIKYDEAYRKFEEYKSSSMFVRLWLGY